MSKEPTTTSNTFWRRFFVDASKLREGKVTPREINAEIKAYRREKSK